MPRRSYVRDSGLSDYWSRNKRPVSYAHFLTYQLNFSETTISDFSLNSLEKLEYFDDDVSKLSAGAPPEEPTVRLNGGFTAWSQVFVSFLLVMNGFGYFSSFGLFESHWVDFLQTSPSMIAWVGSLSLFLLFMLGSLSGPLVDKGYFRSVVLVGCMFQLLGVFSTSCVTEYWQLLLAQGVTQGIGNGLLFTPCVTLVSLYFTKNRAFALSLAACGAPIGGICFPLVSKHDPTSYFEC
jgi:hypothetical protein